MLKDRIINKESGFLFYGLTPPKINTEEDKVGIIADKQVKRIRGLEIDGLVLYDIQDESSRTDSPRPFPFMPTLAPNYYSDKYLSDLKVPKIIYKSVGKYTADEFRSWIYQNSNNIDCSVFVGSPSKIQVSGISLRDVVFLYPNVFTVLITLRISSQITIILQLRLTGIWYRLFLR